MSLRYERDGCDQNVMLKADIIESARAGKDSELISMEKRREIC